MTEPLAAAVADLVTPPLDAGLRVVDEDGLVRSAPVLDELAARGFPVVVWSDPIEARSAWASRVDATRPIVIVDRLERADQLPADVLAEAAAVRRVGVEDVFGTLSLEIIRWLEWGDRAGAFDLVPHVDGVLDAGETASRLLRSLHQLDPETMAVPSLLLAGLLRLHRVVRPYPVSPGLVSEFARRIGDPLPGIPTADAVTDRSRFLAWLGTVWETAATAPEAHDMRSLLLAEGPAQLLDDYLDDGLLESVPRERAVAGLPFGVGGDTTASRADRVTREMEWIRSQLAGNEPTYLGWQEIAERWADVLALHYQDRDTLRGDMADVRREVNRAFGRWLIAHFPSLSSLSSFPSPAMVHKTAHALESGLARGPQALVVVDGLSLAVWRVLAAVIRRPDWRLNEATAFAWVPTITSISRQSIFAGRPPVAFAKSIGTTSRESELWGEWWAEAQKLPSHEVGYIRLHLRNDARDGLAAVPAAASQLGRRVLALVVEDVDHELHGERLGEGTFHAAMRSWGQAGYLRDAIDCLLDEGYAVVLTSDHGFAEVRTIGVSQAGATADAHGRFEVFSDELLLEHSLAKGKPPGRSRWPGHGLPRAYGVVLAPLDGALKPAGDRLLTHGGITIEEVVVPWVRITR